MSTDATVVSDVCDACASYSAIIDGGNIPPGYKPTEVGVIPLDWQVKQIRELGHIKTGPFGTLLKAEEYSTSDGVPLISVGEIGAGAIEISDHTPRAPDAVIRRLPQYVLRSGDIVFGRKGAVDRSALITNKEDGWFLGSDGISVRPIRTCFAPYLAWQLQRSEVRVWLLQHAIGTTMASLNQSVLSRVQIPYATLPEQRAIAEALSDVDGSLGTLEVLIAKKRAIKQAAMQHLLTGKTRLPGFRGQWETRKLGNECERITKGTTPTSIGRKFTTEGINFIKVESITEDGNPISNHIASIDEATHRLLKRSQLKAHDILFSIAGALGRTAIVKESWLPANTNQALAIIRLKSDSTLRHDFLAEYLAGPQIAAHVESINVQAAQANVSLRAVEDFTIGTPSPDEQHAIATVLSDMASEIAALGRWCKKMQAIKQGMMQQLLTGRVRMVKPEDHGSE